MFNSGIPEKLIAENSGHRSTKALRCYEKTAEELQQAVTKVINYPGGDHQISVVQTSLCMDSVVNEKDNLTECKPVIPLVD